MTRRWFVLLGATLFAAACASANRTNGDPAIVERLYFGRNIGDSAVVSDSSWRRFLDEVVTPRFASGFTAWRADGQWRDPNGRIVREPSFVLEIVLQSPANISIDEVIAEYKRRFRQQAVLRVRTGASMLIGP